MNASTTTSASNYGSGESKFWVETGPDISDRIPGFISCDQIFIFEHATKPEKET